MIVTLIGIFLAFLSGSLPLSVWIGRLALGVDIRQVGDGNPGAANVWAAGGPFWGMIAILGDGFKGLIPVALANFTFGWQGWPLVLFTIAPVLGHAFSPFLRFRGGKALAVTFGVWTGLTVWVGPISLGLAFIAWQLLIKKDRWAVLGGSLTQLLIFLIIGVDWTWLAVWAGIFLVLLIKQLADTRRPT